MRKSLLLTILLVAALGCGDDGGLGPEPSVRANLIIDFEAWDQEGQERRGVRISIVRDVAEFRYFENLPQEGVVTITTNLPCSGDLLYDPIAVHVWGIGVSGTTWLDGFACTEEPQVVEIVQLVVPGGCINPDNWLGDC